MANTDTIKKNNPGVPEWIRTAIQKEIELVTKEELEAAQKRIEQRKGQIVAGVMIYIQKELQIETIGEKLIITVRMQ